MKIAARLTLLAAASLATQAAYAQSAPNLTVLEGLVPVAVLSNTAEGKAALDANQRITTGIQMGTLRQPTLLPFADQQALALRDAFITDGNATELADALGTKLGALYQTKAHYDDFEHFSSVSQNVADLLGYTNEVTKSDSNAGKYYFANRTKDGKAPVSSEAAAIMDRVGGTTDVFGKAYGRLAGDPGSDAYGDARPLQTDPSLLAFRASDYFGKPSHSVDWLRGPSQNLTDSPSYPSGHTTYGYTESLILAILVPERYQQMIARGAEYGNNRIILGAHYAMDVLGGRTLSLHDVAHLLANAPGYIGRPLRNTAKLNEMGQASNESVTLTDYPAALEAARADLDALFSAECGNALASCAAQDTSRFSNRWANAALIDATQTYGLPVVYPAQAAAEDVGKLAPEAGRLLTAAFPKVTLDEANAILTATEGPGGGFLDNGSSFGVYSRLNLFAAAGRAAELEASRKD